MNFHARAAIHSNIMPNAPKNSINTKLASVKGLLWKMSIGSKNMQGRISKISSAKDAFKGARQPSTAINAK